MKYHVLFVIFDKAKKIINCRLLQIIGGPLRVKRVQPKNNFLIFQPKHMLKLMGKNTYNFTLKNCVYLELLTYFVNTHITPKRTRFKLMWRSIFHFSLYGPMIWGFNSWPSTFFPHRLKYLLL